MQKNSEVYLLPIEVTLQGISGRDPEQMSEPQRCIEIAVRCLFYVESLFWVIGQLGQVGQNGGWIYQKSSYYEALERIGELGAGLTDAASEHAQRLAHLAAESAPEE